MPLERIFKPVGEDKTVNQVFISTNTQNVRDNDNNILGTAQSGFYNVYSIVHNNNYNWYEIEDNCFVAGVENRVYYIPKEIDVETSDYRERAIQLYNIQISEYVYNMITPSDDLGYIESMYNYWKDCINTEKYVEKKDLLSNS
jgi:hypothetical protein